MNDEEKEVTEIVNVTMPVEPLAYRKITGLTVPDDDEAEDDEMGA